MICSNREFTKVLKVLFTFLLLIFCNSITYSQQLHTYFGLLHAHTMICDGVGTPEEAYNMAKETGLHFFAVTPHNHIKSEDGAKERKDGILINKNHALYNGDSDVTVNRKWKESGVERTETITLTPLLKAAIAATNQNFLALYGQEFSTISSGNHVNVIGIDEVINADNGDYYSLIELLEEINANGKTTPVLQLNHPDVRADLFYRGNNDNERKKMFNDYGIDDRDLGPHFRDMIAALDPYVHLIEVLSGPAMKTQRVENFRYSANENDYYFYLKQGFHISPSAGQDNHYKTWGIVTDARTGVLATNLTQEALFDAFTNHRTFASEDKNLKVSYTANNKIMGSRLEVQEETELDIKLTIEDPDESGAGYRVLVYSSEINPELSTEATDWKAADGLVMESNYTGNGTYSINNIFTSSEPSFIYLKIIQDDGDRLWTAPVWINDNTNIILARNVYYWTKSTSSRVYHHRNCPAVKSIKPGNLMSGDIPPAGRTLHSCTIGNEDQH